VILPKCPTLSWKMWRLAYAPEFRWRTLDPRYGSVTLFCLDGTFSHIGFGFMWQRAAAPEQVQMRAMYGDAA